MKKALSLAIAMLMTMTLLLTACNQPVVITLTSAKATAKQGETVQLTSSLEGVTYEFTEGSTHATVSESGLVTVNSDAEIGAVLKLVAKKDLVTSNTVEIEIVHTAITSLSAAKATIGSETVTVVAPNDEVTLAVTVSPSNATEAVTWSIANDYAKATITGNKLTVGDTAENNDTIILIASGGTKVSNAVTLTVSKTIALNTITLSTSKSKIQPGESVTLTTVFNPANATNRAVEWVITGISDIPQPNAQGVLSVPVTADDGTLTIKAKVGAIESNEITVVVETPVTVKSISLHEDVDLENDVLITRNNNTAPVLSVTVTDQDGKPTGDEVVFTPSDGANNVNLTKISGAPYSRTVNVARHGEAVITVSLKDGGATPLVVPVKSIKTPTRIDMPSFIDYALTGGELDAYAIGTYHAENNNLSVPFAAIIPQTGLDVGACTDVTYEFEKLTAGGAVDTSVASADLVDLEALEAGQLRFKQTGRIKMTIESNSGNYTEVKDEQIFEVNEGKNIGTWEALKDYMSVEQDGANRPAEYTVNLVVPTVTMKVGNQDLYDIIPNFVASGYDSAVVSALREKYAIPQGAHNDEAFINHTYIHTIDKGITINGNNHPINFSQMRPFVRSGGASANTEVEYLNVFGFRSSYIADKWKYLKSDGSNDALLDGDLIYLMEKSGVNPAALGLTGSNPNFPQGDFPIYGINLSNLKIYGNIRPDGKSVADPSASAANYVHDYAISIGDRNNYAHFVVKSENLEIQNFTRGIGLSRALSVGDEDDSNDSYFYNTRLYDIYNTGITLTRSIVEFEDLDIGFCGSFGFDLVQASSNQAGLNDDEKASVKITGKYTPGVLNNAETHYLNSVAMQVAANVSLSTKDILNLTIIENYNLNQVDHIRSPGNYYMLAVYATNDVPDTSRIEYNLPRLVALLTTLQYDSGQITTESLKYALAQIYNETLFDAGTATVNLRTLSTTVNTNSKYIQVPVQIPYTILETYNPAYNLPNLIIQNPENESEAFLNAFIGHIVTNYPEGLPLGNYYMTNHFYNPAA